MGGTNAISTREAARILNATEAGVRRWARLGGLHPRAGPGGTHEFTFQQLLLLRTTRGLLEAGIPPRRVRRVWSSLRRQLSADLPLTSIRILADGDRAVAWHGNAPWQPDSGQFLLDFSGLDVACAADDAFADPPATAPSKRTAPDLTVVHPAGESAEESREVEAPARATQKPARPASEPSTSALSAAQWFQIACELESDSPVEARQAYLLALAADPAFADAHLNLGRLAHQAGELDQAEAHYRDAARSAPEDETAHFNLAVLLEDRGRAEEAIPAYQRAIELDPDFADAHYNLGLLLERRGLRSDAFRHLMTARRLYELTGRGH